MKYLLIFILTFNYCLLSQESIYISKSANLVTFSNSNIAIFDDLINDAVGGFTFHNPNPEDSLSNGGNVYLIRHSNHGQGSSRIYGGPNTTTGIDDFNSGGSYCRFWNFYTDNTVGQSVPSNTQVNQDYGSGNIQIEQEIKINHSHNFINGMIWTPRSKWRNAFINYEFLSDKSKIEITGIKDSQHIDGYATVSGNPGIFFLPVGDGIKLRACGSSLNFPHQLRAAYFNINPLNDNSGISGIIPMPYDTANREEDIVRICKTEFWDIDASSNAQIYLTKNNSAGYSEWNSNFKNINNITIAGFDGKWKDLKSNFDKVNSFGDSVFKSEPFNITDKFSMFTWAEVDTNISGIDGLESDNSKFITVADESKEIITFKFSFGYNGNGTYRIIDLTGTELLSSKVNFNENENFLELDKNYNLSKLSFIQIISNKNDILSYKLIK